MLDHRTKYGRHKDIVDCHWIFLQSRLQCLADSKRDNVNDLARSIEHRLFNLDSISILYASKVKVEKCSALPKMKCSLENGQIQDQNVEAEGRDSRNSYLTSHGAYTNYQ